MFDLKDNYIGLKAAIHIYIYIYIYFTWGGFGEVNVMKIVNENFVQYGFCLQM